MFTCITESLFHTSYLSQVLSNKDLNWVVRNERSLNSKKLTEAHKKLSSKNNINESDIRLLENVYGGLSEAENYLAKKYGVPVSHPLEKAKFVTSKRFDEVFFRECSNSDDPIDKSGAIIFLDVILKDYWIDFFENRIVNSHSAVLPHARGMFAIEQLMINGSREDVEKAAGATIHYLDNGIDTGKIINYKEVQGLWRLPSIWAVKGESYILAFDLIKNYLESENIFCFNDSFESNANIKSPIFFSKNFTENAKKTADLKFLLQRKGG